uniref:Arylamine N-acetyltransferase n=1 Tax=Sphingobacterium sp. (strain 21) TaxID=743722 RepID=F4C7H3_SPHS2
MVDLKAYLERIHYTQRPDTNLETLMEIHRLHPKYIPFENLNPLTGRPISLGIEDIFDKLILSHRGGYCFEHNTLFKQVLIQLGFQVSGFWARVIWNIDPTQITARTHMLLHIVYEGQAYIADVGFGAMTLTAPLLFAPDIVQETQHGIFRIIQKEKFYILQVLQENEWRSIYQFYTEVLESIDYEVANWYVSTHPNSHFTKQLIVAKVDDDGRYTLHDNVLNIRYDSGRKESFLFSTACEVIEVLQHTFNIRTRGLDNLEEVLSAIISTKQVS